jgi:hypothetical protein
MMDLKLVEDKKEEKKEEKIQEFNMNIYADLEKKVVVVDFGMPITWLAMTQEQVIGFAKNLLIKSKELSSSIIIPG